MAFVISYGPPLAFLGWTAAFVGGLWLLAAWSNRIAAAARRQGGGLSFNTVLGRMRRAAQPTLLLTPAQAPGFSKLGGLPDLPAGLDWPGGTDGPRAFLGQIDLEAAGAGAGLDWLPADGRLHLFVDEERYGFADLVRVLHSREVPVGERTPPAGLRRKFLERRVAFIRLTSLPSLDWLGVAADGLAVSDEELDRLSDLPDAPFGDDIQHRIGGYPSEIQASRMQVECERLRRGLDESDGAEVPEAVHRASRQWRLLIQVDSDPALGMNWGDGGRLYVFIRKADAERADFSRTVTLFQTH